MKGLRPFKLPALAVIASPDYVGTQGLSGGRNAKILRYPDFLGIPQNDI